MTFDRAHPETPAAPSDERASGSTFRLDGKTALISGAARGIGWGIAEALARAGAHVILNDIDAAALAERSRDLSARGLSHSLAAFDVSCEEAVVAAVQQAVETVGAVDVLVNNAGLQNRKGFLELSYAEWRRMLSVHLDGAYHLTRAVAPHMVARKHGRIIMIGSIATQSVKVPSTPYVAAKGALTALTRALAFELGPSGVTCNTISPGMTQTELTRALQDDPAYEKFIRERVPLQRWGTPADIAPAAVYLASDAGAFVNGANLVIDGGVLAML
ncbi:SDR family NAD(P)-dependent oxidoreductase [Variovorax sp. KK3]|uniref:SDR family NAD(P)-dependent oxidoreductase n=1 Tax=Variovorax sp. KK3 TaxID=1855728 RepID=UPI00097C6DB1|nr:glucose 1-dehydrogenase [Variovorax sp. KK3]